VGEKTAASCFSDIQKADISLHNLIVLPAKCRGRNEGLNKGEGCDIVLPCLGYGTLQGTTVDDDGVVTE
jgi:hypothetical protein